MVWRTVQPLYSVTVRQYKKNNTRCWLPLFELSDVPRNVMNCSTLLFGPATKKCCLLFFLSVQCLCHGGPVRRGQIARGDRHVFTWSHFCINEKWSDSSKIVMERDLFLILIRIQFISNFKKTSLSRYDQSSFLNNGVFCTVFVK